MATQQHSTSPNEREREAFVDRQDSRDSICCVERSAGDCGDASGLENSGAAGHGWDDPVWPGTAWPRDRSNIEMYYRTV